MLTQLSCVSVINPTWSWCIIVFGRFWIQLVNILLRTFASAFTRDINLCVLGRPVRFDSATHWTVACQAPLSMGFSREYWNGCHFLLQGIFPTQGSTLSLLCLLHCRQILQLMSHPGSFLIFIWFVIRLMLASQNKLLIISSASIL